ncbi:DUF4232 domain-containing protein [Nocardioides sp. J54]|uniref:DUF4232 domain-containing protein n=1 Tax=Nocardioides sp. J54 TaxID=935866 RepID=UPI00048A4A74|nr:DUF4232 domain-containing protein [Nocardioides sp. J54]
MLRLGTPLLVVVLSGALSGGLAGCSDGTDDRPPGGPGTSVAADGPSGTTAPPGLEEVPPGYDESPDGAPPVADEQLQGDALVALLRTRAAVDPGPDHCGPDDVTGSLRGIDAAAGTRVTTLVVRNTSDRSCVVEGVPGIGVRGTWGSTFVPEVGHRDHDAGGNAVPRRPVRVAPGEEATLHLLWSGALAGAEQEQASIVVVQLAAGQVPITVPALIDGHAADIGQFTTLSLSPFQPA